MSKKPLMVGPTGRAQKRILHDFKDIQRDPSQYFTAAPRDDNLFEWHFTIRGPQDSEFHGGKYHGKLLIPTNFPFAPPDFIFLTPNGRYKVGTKICLTITSFHTETWQSTWSIRKMLEAVAMFMVTPAMGAYGALETPEDVSRQLATESRSWICPHCNKSNDVLLPGEFDPEAEQRYLAKCRLANTPGSSTVASTPATPAVTSPVTAPVPTQQTPGGTSGAAAAAVDSETPAAAPPVVAGTSPSQPPAVDSQASLPVPVPLSPPSDLPTTDQNSTLDQSVLSPPADLTPIPSTPSLSALSTTPHVDNRTINTPQQSPQQRPIDFSSLIQSTLSYAPTLSARPSATSASPNIRSMLAAAAQRRHDTSMSPQVGAATTPTTPQRTPLLGATPQLLFPSPRDVSLSATTPPVTTPTLRPILSSPDTTPVSSDPHSTHSVSHIASSTVTASNPTVEPTSFLAFSPGSASSSVLASPSVVPTGIPLDTTPTHQFGQTLPQSTDAPIFPLPTQHLAQQYASLRRTSSLQRQHQQSTLRFLLQRQSQEQQQQPQLQTTTTPNNASVLLEDQSNEQSLSHFPFPVQQPHPMTNSIGASLPLTSTSTAFMEEFFSSPQAPISSSFMLGGVCTVPLRELLPPHLNDTITSPIASILPLEAAHAAVGQSLTSSSNENRVGGGSMEQQTSSFLPQPQPKPQATILEKNYNRLQLAARIQQQQQQQSSQGSPNTVTSPQNVERLIPDDTSSQQRDLKPFSIPSQALAVWTSRRTLAIQHTVNLQHKSYFPRNPSISSKMTTSAPTSTTTTTTTVTAPPVRTPIGQMHRSFTALHSRLTRHALFIANRLGLASVEAKKHAWESVVREPSNPFIDSSHNSRQLHRHRQLATACAALRSLTLTDLTSPALITFINWLCVQVLSYQESQRQSIAIRQKQSVSSPEHHHGSIFPHFNSSAETKNTPLLRYLSAYLPSSLRPTHNIGIALRRTSDVAQHATIASISSNPSEHYQLRYHPRQRHRYFTPFHSTISSRQIRAWIQFRRKLKAQVAQSAAAPHNMSTTTRRRVAKLIPAQHEIMLSLLSSPAHLALQYITPPSVSAGELQQRFPNPLAASTAAAAAPGNSNTDDIGEDGDDVAPQTKGPSSRHVSNTATSDVAFIPSQFSHIRTKVSRRMINASPAVALRFLAYQLQQTLTYSSRQRGGVPGRSSDFDALPATARTILTSIDTGALSSSQCRIMPYRQSTSHYALLGAPIAHHLQPLQDFDVLGRDVFYSQLTHYHEASRDLRLAKLTSLLSVSSDGTESKIESKTEPKTGEQVPTEGSGTSTIPSTVSSTAVPATTSTATTTTAAATTTTTTTTSSSSFTPPAFSSRHVILGPWTDSPSCTVEMYDRLVLSEATSSNAHPSLLSALLPIRHFFDNTWSYRGSTIPTVLPRAEQQSISHNASALSPQKTKNEDGGEDQDNDSAAYSFFGLEVESRDKVITLYPLESDSLTTSMKTPQDGVVSTQPPQQQSPSNPQQQPKDASHSEQPSPLISSSEQREHRQNAAALWEFCHDSLPVIYHARDSQDLTWTPIHALRAQYNTMAPFSSMLSPSLNSQTASYWSSISPSGYGFSASSHRFATKPYISTATLENCIQQSKTDATMHNALVNIAVQKTAAVPPAAAAASSSPTTTNHLPPPPFEIESTSPSSLLLSKEQAESVIFAVQQHHQQHRPQENQPPQPQQQAVAGRRRLLRDNVRNFLLKMFIALAFLIIIYWMDLW